MTHFELAQASPSSDDARLSVLPPNLAFFSLVESMV